MRSVPHARGSSEVCLGRAGGGRILDSGGPVPADDEHLGGMGRPGCRERGHGGDQRGSNAPAFEHQRSNIERAPELRSGSRGA